MVERYIENFDLRAIAQSGQCFRMGEVAEHHFELMAGDALLSVRELGDSRYRFDCSAEAYERVWKPYFDLDADYAAYIQSIPPEDAFLSDAAAFGGGLRILRQDPWEMLITFIISQRKNIPAIRGAVEALCQRYGRPVEREGVRRFAFPTPEALALHSAQAFRQCALGYRCAYVQAAARMVAEGALDVYHLHALPDQELLEALMTVPGVGPKVANCVMLFGYHRIAAFPRDVWINRMIDQEYGGHFPLERYEGYAGVIQQYIFYYARMRAAAKAAPIQGARGSLPSAALS